MKMVLVAFVSYVFFSPVLFAATATEEMGRSSFFSSKPLSGTDFTAMLEEIKRRAESEAYKEAQKLRALYEKEFYADTYGADPENKKGAHLY